jgi:hypothetical protein
MVDPDLNKSQIVPINLRSITKLNKRHLLISKLLGDPSLTDSQIATIAKCSRTTVHFVKKRLKLLGLQGDESEELEQYRMLLRKKVPVGSRVDSLATIINPDQAKSNPFSVIRAVEYVDTVLGLHPKARQEAQEVSNQAQPMFVLPAGARMQVNVITESPNKRVEKRIKGSREED